MTVQRMRSEMTQEEFRYWVVFFKRRQQEDELRR